MVLTSFFIISSILLLAFGAYLLRTQLKIADLLWSAFVIFRNYFYLFLVPLPVLYLIYYGIVFREGNADTYFVNLELTKTLKDISFIFFTAGIFSAAAKLISSLKIFKENFNTLILSDEFDQVISSKLEILAYADETILSHSNIHEIWQKVTLAKCKARFPHLIPKLKHSVNNTLFIDSKLSFYYQNFRMQVNCELVQNRFIRITEITNCTIQTDTVDPIVVDVFVSSAIQPSNNVYSRIIPDQTKINGILITENEYEICKSVNQGSTFKQPYRYFLKDETEYHIERVVEMQQDINDDRIYSMTISKIIDDIHIEIRYCNKLAGTFSSIGKVSFKEDNMKGPGHRFENRGLLLPDDGFKLFLYRKN